MYAVHRFSSCPLSQVTFPIYVDDSSEGVCHVSTDVILIAESLSVSICKTSRGTHYSDSVSLTLF